MVNRLPLLRRKDSPDLRRVLKSVMALLTYSHDRTEARFEEIMKLMEKTPSWMDWTGREDTFFGPTITNLVKNVSTSEDEQGSSVNRDHYLMVKNLIQENGGYQYMDENDFLLASPQLKTFYLFWLQSESAPTDTLAHIRDEDGVWLRDESVRERVRSGWIVDIPMRMVRRRVPNTIPASPDRGSIKCGRWRAATCHKIPGAPVKPRPSRETDVCKQE